MRMLTALVAGLCLSLTTQAQYTPTHVSFVHVDTLEAFVDNDRILHIYQRSDSAVDVIDLAHYYSVATRDILDAANFVPSTEESFRAYLIPIDNSRVLKGDCLSADCIPLIYTVRPKETAFRIAKRYFDMKVETLRDLNGMESNDLAIGQRLLVGWFVPNKVESSPEITDSLEMAALPVDPFYPEVPVVRPALAYWNKAQSDYTNMFALHREARPYSLMEITNPMMGTKVLVKVLGTIPPSYTQDVDLVVSPAVARRLGVLDPRFRAELRFVE